MYEPSWFLPNLQSCTKLFPTQNTGSAIKCMRIRHNGGAYTHTVLYCTSRLPSNPSSKHRFTCTQNMSVDCLATLITYNTSVLLRKARAYYMFIGPCMYVQDIRLVHVQNICLAALRTCLSSGLLPRTRAK